MTSTTSKTKRSTKSKQSQQPQEAEVQVNQSQSTETDQSAPVSATPKKLKITCHQKELAERLSLLARIVPSRNVHPVLTHVLIQANKEKQQITLTGFDLNLGMTITFATKVHESGEFTVPARILLDLVSQLPQEELTLELLKDNRVQVTASVGKYKIAGIEATEFPQMPVAEGEEVEIQSESILSGIDYTLFSASTDDTKQVLTGVRFVIGDDHLEVASTDGHRLSVYQHGEDNSSAEHPPLAEVTVPASALTHLQRILSGTEGFSMQCGKRSDAGQILSDSTITFKTTEHTLFSRLLDGAYPRYRELVPTAFSRRVVANRKQMLSTLDRVGLFSENNVVKLEFEKESNTLRLSIDGETGDANEQMPVNIDELKDTFTIAFNLKYLSQALRVMSSDEVQFNMNEHLSPVVLKPIWLPGSDGKKSTSFSEYQSFVHLLMPVQVRI